MRITAVLVVATLLFAGASVSVMAEKNPPMPGETFPAIRLPMPIDEGQRNYLGLTGTGSFSIDQIRAEVVVIEVFSMYCPHCQREAPTMNRFYNRIQENPSLKDRVKLIGIGAGNSEFEVSHFKDVYKIPFPLFPDDTYAIHQVLGEVRTPYFIGVRLGKGATVFYSKLGGPKDASQFLDEMMDQSGLSTGGKSHGKGK